MDTTHSGSSLAFNSDNERRFQKMLPHYPEREAACIPALHLALRQWGHLSAEVIEYVAGRLSLPPSKVLAVQSFYTMLNREPLGRHNIQVCQTLSCALAGADGLIEHLEKRLGIHCGQTTPDGRFTISTAECLASCGTAPVVQVNVDEYEENVTAEKLDRLLERLK